MARSRRREVKRTLKTEGAPTRRQKILAWVIVLLFVTSTAGVLVSYFASG